MTNNIKTKIANAKDKVRDKVEENKRMILLSLGISASAVLYLLHVCTKIKAYYEGGMMGVAGTCAAFDDLGATFEFEGEKVSALEFLQKHGSLM